MDPDPRIRPDLTDTSSWDDSSPAQATGFFSAQPNVTQVAQTLAAHNGGEAFVDLAFDLVLNDVVERGRDATGATGAAVALLRDGELVCRATTGGSAPDLGVRVETKTGLAAACLTTGQIQQCLDTEIDPRVNAEACRRLGVRSMLIVPLIDAKEMFGILQAFSASPNAFGQPEISALQLLAQRISDNKKEVDAGAPTSSEPAQETQNSAEPGPESALDVARTQEDRTDEATPEYMPLQESQRPKRSEMWSSFLVVLVIGAAVLLGVVVGWHGAAKLGSGASASESTPAAANNSTATDSSSQQSNSPVSAAQQDSPSTVGTTTPANPAPTPSGGLVVTENGRVVYRSPSPVGAAPVRSSGTRLIHRVEPAYPPEARAQNLQGAVVLEVQVHGDGSVGDIDVISGDAVLAKAAVDAVKQWKYRPSFANGHAIESQAKITVRFKLPPS